MSTFTYNIIYLFINIFGTYVIYLFMETFFKQDKKYKKLSFLCYFIYYLITSMVYIFVHILMINIISSILSFFIITLSYRSSVIKKITISILCFITLLFAETAVAFAIGVSNIDPLQSTYYGNLMSLIMCEILKFIIIKIIRRFKNLGSNIAMPWSFLITVILVTAISFFLEMQLFTMEDVNNVLFVLSLICILLLNFIVFYLYDSITKVFNEKIQSEMIKSEIQYYHKQAELIQKNAEETRRMRHDMKNHLIVINELIKSGNKAQIEEYISNFVNNMEAVKSYSSTGILQIDSIINYKLTNAEKLGISIHSEIAIPNSLTMNHNDFVAILGNLLDNAVDAASLAAETKYIKLHIKYIKGTVFISIKNSFDGKLKMISNEYVTTKKDSLHHGIGIKSVNSTVQKYDGEMSISHSKNEFSTKILLYL